MVLAPRAPPQFRGRQHQLSRTLFGDRRDASPCAQAVLADEWSHRVEVGRICRGRPLAGGIGSSAHVHDLHTGSVSHPVRRLEETELGFDVAAVEEESLVADADASYGTD